jgi:4-hydroxy-tetrahydrodipicolinate synthase
MRTGTGNNLKAALNAGMGAILMEGNLFTKRIANVFAAHRQGKDIDAPLASLRAAQQVLRPGGVGSFGPMKYALSLQMGTRQTYQRPPNPDVTEEQKKIIKAKLEELKQMPT